MTAKKIPQPQVEPLMMRAYAADTTESPTDEVIVLVHYGKRMQPIAMLPLSIEAANRLVQDLISAISDHAMRLRAELAQPKASAAQLDKRKHRKKDPPQNLAALSIKAILSQPALYTVIDDGQFKYPVFSSAVKKRGTTLADLRAMDGDHYKAWCTDVPMLRDVTTGTQECIDLCDKLVASGATHWRIG